MGNIFLDQGKNEAARNCYQQALEIEPNFDMARKNLGLALIDLGKTEEAKACFRGLLGSQPRFEIELLLAMTHPIIFPSVEAMEKYVVDFQNELKRLQRKPEVIDDPYNAVGQTNFGLGMLGCRQKEMREGIARLYLQACPDLAWTAQNLKRSRMGGRIQIGFVSKYLHDHTIGRLYHGLIEHLSGKFHVTVFHLAHKHDPVSNGINGKADDVLCLPMKLNQARRIIADKRLDILFYPEIGMDPFTYFLAFSRLAPVQVKRGFQITMGIPNIDYFISSKWAEPKSAQDHYSEKLILLKTTGYYYIRPQKPAKPPKRSQLGLPEGGKLYACPQSLFKIHPEFDTVIGKILEKDPHGRLVLIKGRYEHWESLLLQRFERSIPHVMKRICFLPVMPRDQFLKLFLVSDAVLDTIHISGGNTSLECFAWGVPVVTWPSPYLPGRLTYGFYKQMGILDCVADSLDEYADLAIKLANDKQFYNSIKNKIESRSQRLFEDESALKELETFFCQAVDQAYRNGPEERCKIMGSS
jgi:predicted O-linked N-acetylglucosamine transferase (SPINDLY family)